MKNLLYKEFRLCMQPLVVIFFAAAFMLLIPSYMYLVPFFFTGNSLFNSMQVSTANSDTLFTAMLPVSKREIVKSKYLFIICVQLIMLALCVPMIFLNHSLIGMPNKAGIDACPALFCGAFIVYTVFNATFLPVFYRNGYKAEKAFLISTVAVFAFIFVFEGFFIACGSKLNELSPFFAWMENNIDCWPKDAHSLLVQLGFAGIGLVIYVIGTYLSYRRSCALFDRVDI